MTKVCSGCKLEKPLIDFHKNKCYKDGYNYKCILCRKAGSNFHSKKWRANNRDRAIVLCKEWRQKNLDYTKEYYQKNKYKNLEQKREWRKLHMRKQRENINFKLGDRLRSRLTWIFKNNTKVGSAVRDLGCTIEEFKVYLSIFFYNNQETGIEMTWDNYGRNGWEIDHIIPLHSFNLENREEFLKACHFSNLQPLWRKDNYTKKHNLNWTHPIF